MAFRLPANGSLSRLPAVFRKYHPERSIEKSYLHTNRAVYLPGETVWLKDYLFNGNTHMTDDANRVLYTELAVPYARCTLNGTVSLTVIYKRHNFQIYVGGIQNES